MSSGSGSSPRRARPGPRAGATFAGQKGPILALAVDQGGAKVVTGSADKTAKVFEVATGKELLTLQGHGDAVKAVVVTRDGQKVVTGSGDKTVKVWNLADGKLLLTYPPLASPVASLAVGADNKTLLVGLADGSAKVFDLSSTDPTKAERQAIAAHAGPISAVAVLPDNVTLLTASDDKTIKTWSVVNPGALKNLAGHGSQVYSVTWSPDALKALTGSADASARLWDLAKGAQTKALEKAHANVVYAVAWSPKGDVFATGGDDKLVKFWDPVEGKELRKGEGHGGAVYCLAFRPDGAQLASGSVDKTIRIWNVADGKEAHKLDGHPDDVYGLAFSPDGKRLASVGYAGNLLTWDVESGKTLGRHKLAPGVMTYGIAWSPDGKLLAVAGSDNKGLPVQRPLILGRDRSLHIEAFEPVFVGSEDLSAADLEGRRQLAGLDLERPAEHKEGPDALGLADGLHDPIDPLGEEGPERPGCDQLVFDLDRAAEFRRLGGERGEVGHDQGRDEGLPVAVDDGLVDVRVVGQEALQRHRGDVLAAGGDDEVLLAVGDRQVAVLVERPHVARVQPAVDDRGLRRLWVVPVAEHDVRPSGEDLAVVGDPDLDPGDRPADRAELLRPGTAVGDHRRGLGLAVPFQEHQAGFRETRRDRQGQGGAPGSQHPEAWPERGFKPAGPLLGREPLDARPDLVIEPRDRVHPGRPDLFEIGQDRLHRLGEAERRADEGGRVVVARPGVDVAEREPAQLDLVGGGLQQDAAHPGVREQVPMREHHPLGVPGQLPLV